MGSIKKDVREEELTVIQETAKFDDESELSDSESEIQPSQKDEERSKPQSDHISN